MGLFKGELEGLQKYTLMQRQGCHETCHGGGRGRERQPDRGSAPWAGHLEAKPASVPWGGRDPDAQSAVPGPETCGFGGHLDT